jgi:hypothetical protein
MIRSTFLFKILPQKVSEDGCPIKNKMANEIQIISPFIYVNTKPATVNNVIFSTVRVTSIVLDKGDIYQIDKGDHYRE